MKNLMHIRQTKASSPSFLKKGFTLVELLIVIAIIMVLAALGFAGLQAALKNSKKVKSMSVATNLNTAIQSFYDEYGMFPVSNVTTSEIKTDQESGVELLKVLMGKETGTTVLNTRGLPFFSATQGKGQNGDSRKDGLRYLGPNVAGLYDAFGNPYTILLDADGLDEIKDPTSPGSIIRGRKSIVYTPGFDQKVGGTSANRDNVKTW